MLSVLSALLHVASVDRVLLYLVAVVPASAVQPMNNQLQSERQTIQLSCNVSGRPTPSMSWTKNGEEVVSSSRVIVHGNELVIAQAAVSDSGIYQCWAENAAGRTTLTARVLVRLTGMPECFIAG